MGLFSSADSRNGAIAPTAVIITGFAIPEFQPSENKGKAMSLMEHRADHCQTAEDVRAAALKVIARHLADRPKRQPKPVDLPHPFILEIIKRAEFMPPEPPPIIELIASEEPPFQIRIRDVQRTVCRAWGIRLNELLSNSKSRRCTIPRHVSFVLCRLLTIESSVEITRSCGNRDHSTAIHAFKKYQWLLDRLLSDMRPSDFLSAWVNRAHELVTEGKE